MYNINFLSPYLQFCSNNAGSVIRNRANLHKQNLGKIIQNYPSKSSFWSVIYFRNFISRTNSWKPDHKASYPKIMGLHRDIYMRKVNYHKSNRPFHVNNFPKFLSGYTGWSIINIEFSQDNDKSGLLEQTFWYNSTFKNGIFSHFSHKFESRSCIQTRDNCLGSIRNNCISPGSFFINQLGV